MAEKNAPEIERKFLIAYPDMRFLREHAQRSRIIQTYLKSDNGNTARVRKRYDDKTTVYTYTEKRRITNVRRMEYEREISADEYGALLERADESRVPIEKERYCLDYENQLFEIDIYPFYTDRAIMEIELKNEEQKILFPPEIKIIREVTEDGRYTNKALAKTIPYDEI